jgi:hypothetical protein
MDAKESEFKSSDLNTSRKSIHMSTFVYHTYHWSVLRRLCQSQELETYKGLDGRAHSMTILATRSHRFASSNPLAKNPACNRTVSKTGKNLGYVDADAWYGVYACWDCIGRLWVALVAGGFTSVVGGVRPGVGLAVAGPERRELVDLMLGADRADIVGVVNVWMCQRPWRVSWTRSAGRLRHTLKERRHCLMIDTSSNLTTKDSTAHYQKDNNLLFSALSAQTPVLSPYRSVGRFSRTSRPLSLLSYGAVSS